jgi:hypothetical protein
VEAAKQPKPWVEIEKKRSPVRAAQAVKTCFALTGLNLTLLCNPGFQISLRSLFHHGLCCYALSALSLTQMPYGTQKVCGIRRAAGAPRGQPLDSRWSPALQKSRVQYSPGHYFAQADSTISLNRGRYARARRSESCFIRAQFLNPLSIAFWRQSSAMSACLLAAHSLAE